MTPDVAPVNVPVSLKPTLNDNLLIPTSPVPSSLLVNLYTVPFDTDDKDTEPLLATVVNTFVSLFCVLAEAIEIAFTVVLDVNGCVLTVNCTNPFANVSFVLPFLIVIDVASDAETSPIAFNSTVLNLNY